MLHALRSWLNSPGHSQAAGGALASGIGTNTVLFSVINTLFLRPLAFPNPKQLFGVGATDPRIYAAVALFIAVIAGLATWHSARRATKVNPLVALRAE